jgi:hypothetical protein
MGDLDCAFPLRGWIVPSQDIPAGQPRRPQITGAEFIARKRQQALADLLDRLASERGALDTPEDEAD